MELGLACHVCGTMNPNSAPSCSRCGTVLAPAAAGAAYPTAGAQQGGYSPAGGGHAPAGSGPTAPGAPAGPPGGTQPGNQSVPRPGGGGEALDATPPQRFDPATGKPLSDAPASEPASKTLFFGALQQQPVVPRLVVIKGEGGDGSTYHLQGTTTVIGRTEGEITFVEDPFLSPQHAKFTSQDGRLFVQDLGSENGVFLRIKKPTPVEDGSYLLVGEQLLRLDARPLPDGAPNEDGTYYYGSPRPNGHFQVVQCLAGGGEGRIVTADDRCLSMGREGNTLNFPNDRFISGHHARLDVGSAGEVVLTDTGSRNGTFVRLEGAQELFHGDYLFVGQQLLRVEIA